VSYRELERRADRLGHRLQALGVGPDTLVALLAERSIETVVGMLGILKAGGAYLPIDPVYPEARRRLLLDDSGVRAVVAAGETGWRPPPGVELVDAAAAPSPAGAGPPPVSAATPQNIAYVIYTSGSTGTPKGVAVPHDRAVRLFRSTEPWFGFGPGQTWAFFHSAAFDFSVWEIWGALLHGGRLVVVPYLTSRSPSDLRRLLAEERVTVLNQTPSAFRQLLQADLAADEGLDLALDTVVFGGEALDPASLAPWMDIRGHEAPRLVNMYGITETTVHVTYRPLTGADGLAAGSPIGKPIPDLSVHLTDRRLDPVPPPVPGELLVGGAGLARGYLGRPALTAERFVPDPFSPLPGARLYRSGDLARRTAAGELEYLGRIDRQVKVRGFRIELGEVEATLAAFPGLRGAAVVARADGAGEPALAAYVVPEGDGPVAPAELLAYVRDRLPPYMVPRWVTPLDALPLTAHGKLDVAALPEPERARAGDESSYRAPGGALERRLTELWADLLQVDRVGVDDNFFDLGGHSILMLELQRRLVGVVGREVPVVELFSHPTVASLARFLGAEIGDGDGLSEVEDRGRESLRAGGLLARLRRVTLEDHPQGARTDG
jgi:amino acid adenylation domain-containing protein